MCTDEILDALGLAKTSSARRLLRPPARRLAEQVAVYDEIVGTKGLAAGGEWAMRRMAARFEVEGARRLPHYGPLLVVANHPGLADSMALFASIPRPDLRVIAARRPFLSAIPNTSSRLFYIDEDAPHSLPLLRGAIRHLRGGGALLVFPGGRIEPDPAVMDGAAQALERWSHSTTLFARTVPELTVFPALVSGVISPSALGHPLTHLRRSPENRRWLGATLQMLLPTLRRVHTRLTFGDPLYAKEDRDLEAMVHRDMRRLIRSARRA